MKKRVDTNDAEITNALRQIGATVQSLTDVGEGCPDKLIGFRGSNYLLEIKTQQGKLKPNQVEWHETWRGQVATVRSIDEALMVIGAL